MASPNLVWMMSYKRIMSCDNRGKDWTDAAANPGTPRIVSQHKKLEKGKKGFYPESQREDGPVVTLILNFWPPELWENKVSWFYAP